MPQRRTCAVPADMGSQVVARITKAPPGKDPHATAARAMPHLERQDAPRKQGKAAVKGMKREGRRGGRERRDRREGRREKESVSPYRDR